MAFTRRLGFESLESRRLLTAVDIPNDLTGQVLAQVSAPINIDTAAGIRAAEIRIAYDTSILDITEADVLAGSVWANDPSVDLVASVNDAAGTIVVSIFGAEALPANSGSLVTFRFTVQAGATVGSSAVLDLTRVRLNEGAITLDTTPQVGSDATDGRITVVAASQTATVSGVVFADVNLNNQPDATEGLPGVRITLVNTATNAQLQTTTRSDGSYEFQSVAPGSYRIQERQPAAYINGGDNELSVELSSGQVLTGQNFREIGLRPEFVYNRLFTTLVMPIGGDNWVAAIVQINTDAENGIVNARITPPATSVQAEGEASAVVHSRFASGQSLSTTVLAEGEAPAYDLPETNAFPPTSQTLVPSTSRQAAPSSGTLTPPAFIVPRVPPAVDAEPIAVSVPSTRSVEVVGPEPTLAGSPEAVALESLTTVREMVFVNALDNEAGQVIAHDILLVDEAFAVTDSW